MTNDTRLPYRVVMPALKHLSGWKAAERAMYDGSVVLADLDGPTDTNGAVSCYVDEGPLAGMERWLQPLWLQPWKSEPGTGGEW